MTAYRIGFERLGIEVPKNAKGYVNCPKCRDSAKHRHNRTARKLWVATDTGNYKCHNCGWEGRVDSDDWLTGEKKEPVQVEEQYKVHPDGFHDITPAVIAYMATRGIDEAVLRRNRVGTATAAFGPAVAFRTYFSGQLVRAKIRSIAGKQFTQLPGCQPMLYKVEDIFHSTSALICEGEIDALSWEMAGITEAVSLDSGAANPGDGTDGKFKCVDHARAYLDGKERVYIAMDADDPGEYTATMLAQKLGVYRCWKVSYPSGCKDANDVLLTYGADELRNCIRRARRFTLADVAGQNELIRAALDTRYDYYNEVQEKPSCLICNTRGRRYDVAAFGQIGVISGHEKSGKSFVLSCIASSGLGGGNEVLGFRFFLQNRKMIWFDTEQSQYFYNLSQRRLYDMAGIQGNPDHYDAYHLRRFTPRERFEIIEYVIGNTPDLGAVVVDGVVDLIDDYNDLAEAQEVVNALMRWTDERDILLITVLHVNKGDGKLRGHLGSELKNKCDFLIKVSNDGSGNYSVANPTGRYVNFPEFSFQRDEEGLPVFENETPF